MSELEPSKLESGEESQPTTVFDPIEIPELCLVALIGASGCGKSTFARKHFLPTEVISSDTCRAWVSDNELDQSATTDAFDVLHYIANKRLDRGKIVVIDATSVQPEARKVLVDLARAQNVLAVAIVLNVPERVCQERNATRTDRQIPAGAISRQCSTLRRSLRDIKREGFRYGYILNLSQIDNAVFKRTKLWNDRRDDSGPFDIIGDIHGCNLELEELLANLGYVNSEATGYAHPAGRRAFFVGDLVDRGPNSIAVLDIVRQMVESNNALAVPGNHDDKFMRWLRGKKVTLSHGLQETVNQVNALPDTIRDEWKLKTQLFLDSLISHYVLDEGKLVVAHAGLKEKLQGRASSYVRDFCLYGDVSGELDSDGLPVRRDWAAEYRGNAVVVYGHTPQETPTWVNDTINIDTGCVFGGSLTALRWPERELVSVECKQKYAEPSRPFKSVVQDALPSVSPYDLLLSDVYPAEAVSSGNRRILTSLLGTIMIERPNSAAALEIMSRFAVDPRWLVYLPPTMSPCETEPSGPYLEHPRGAFAYFQSQGIDQVMCQEKHMGSRAVIVICRDSETARKRFGVIVDGSIGECYTRTGRRFFDEPVRTQFLQRIRTTLTAAKFWETHNTDWAVIDSEILPWNTKAQGLLRDQYAPVGAAAKASLAALNSALAAVRERGIEIETGEIDERINSIDRYIESYRAYCWETEGLTGIEVAPFHLLATEGAVHSDKTHEWHIDALANICSCDPGFLRKTDTITVDLNDPASIQSATDWWTTRTESSAEGMVVKPLKFIAHGAKFLAQPAVKCRGREYLRIIYGPEYAMARNIDLLRARGLGRKRSLAIREFALGLESLNRFVANAPLHSVHECAFAVLALESEPVDPRL